MSTDLTNSSWTMHKIIHASKTPKQILVNDLSELYSRLRYKWWREIWMPLTMTPIYFLSRYVAPHQPSYSVWIYASLMLGFVALTVMTGLLFKRCKSELAIAIENYARDYTSEKSRPCGWDEEDCNWYFSQGVHIKLGQIADLGESLRVHSQTIEDIRRVMSWLEIEYGNGWSR